jgi:hypothetical protein
MTIPRIRGLIAMLNVRIRTFVEALKQKLPNVRIVRARLINAGDVPIFLAIAVLEIIGSVEPVILGRPTGRVAIFSAIITF